MVKLYIKPWLKPWLNPLYIAMVNRYIFEATTLWLCQQFAIEAMAQSK